MKKERSASEFEVAVSAGDMTMPTDIAALNQRYFEACKRQDILPNKAIVEALFKAKIKKARHELCTFMVLMDDLKDVDFYPLLGIIKEIDFSEIDAVDIVNRSSCGLSPEHVLDLMHTVNNKLRVVDIRDISFGRDFLLDLSQRGLACQVLNLKSSHFRKLSMVGKFAHMHTLNLDFSTSLSGFREDCFSCMPNLRLLSLCETRITNLWTTSAALAKLPSLDELRFQSCLYHSDSGRPASSCINKGIGSGHGELGLLIELPSSSDEVLPHNDEDLDDFDTVPDIQSTNDEFADDSDVDFSGHHWDFGSTELYPDTPCELSDLENEISCSLDTHDGDSFSGGSVNLSTLASVALKTYTSRPSPICFEKHYREYMIASLPNLKVLDNLPITKDERERANDTFTRHFEYLPYNRRSKESVVSLLQKCEIRENLSNIPALRKKRASSLRKSQYFYSRSLSAAKMSAWPTLHPLSLVGGLETRSFRPRQFEYHPTDSSLMVFGTLDGEVVVINHESEKIVSYIPSLGAMHSVLGLCWLKKYPSKLIAGSDNGSLRLYDIQHMTNTNVVMSQSRGYVTFDEFDQLTSVHVNSTDELFLASGYSNSVALYDISSGRRLQEFSNMHQEHINVVKFSNHSPSLFATSSFDKDVKMWDIRQKPNQPCYTAKSSRGNVMVCFSPDDHYLLVSAVDNEVRQLLAADGRLHMDFGIASTGSSQNYTRSYYMNGRDYVISGSCDEHVVRVCCAKTGRRLRDVQLEGKGAMFVQSLRGDPFRDFNMSVLAAYMRPNSYSEIVKINLLSSADQEKLHSSKQQSHSVSGMGG